MNIETLKQLIGVEFERVETISELKKEVFRLIDLYTEDEGYVSKSPNFAVNTEQVPYYQICPCNPSNGGNGVCGCTMGNNLVTRYKI